MPILLPPMPSAARRTCLALASLPFLLPPISGATEETILENASLRIALRDGRISSLRDRSRSLEHVAQDAKASPGLFHIRWVKGTQPAGELDAAEMTSRVTRRAANELELEFDHSRATARAKIRLAETPGESHWSLSVRPKDPTLALASVTYPTLATPSPSGTAEKRYLFPMFEGRFLPLRQPPLWRSYPAELFAQMTACLAPDGGFLLWTDDGEGHVKAFGFDRRDGTAAFGVRHMMPYEAGKEWEMPYRTRLSFCGSAWQDAADVYRPWVTEQSWSGSALRDRKDIPDLLLRPPLCLSTQLDKEDAETLPDRLAAWGKRFNAPVIYRPLGWEKHGNWVGIDYFPPSIGEKSFRDLAARLGQRDIAVAGFISGYRWTTNMQAPRNGRDTNSALRRFFHGHAGDRACERSRDGKLLAFFAEGRDSHRICRGTPFGKQFLQQTAGRLFDLGVPIIHDDQDHGPYPDGRDSCFDTSHGHPIPCGPWSTAATRDAFRQIRADAARRGLNDFFLTKESCTELLNMDLHGYQARFFHESSTPGCIPLAQYLYHDRIPAIFGWVTANSRGIWELAAMLVYGQIPSLAFWNSAAQPPDGMAPDGLTLLQDYYGAMQTHAKDFLLLGRMRHPLIPNTPMAKKDLAPTKGRQQGNPQTISFPLIIQSAWDDGRGNVGLFAVNTGRQEASVQVPAPGATAWRATLYTGPTKDGSRDMAAGAHLEWRLPPGRLGTIVFQPTQSGAATH